MTPTNRIPSDRNQATLRYWKRHARRYELAALLTIPLLAGLAFVLLVPIRGAIEEGERRRREAVEIAEREKDALEAAAAEPLMREAERQRLEKLRVLAEEAKKLRFPP
jgi:hypothetical protein